MNYHNELSMCMYDKHAFRELPPGSVYIHTLCAGPLYWWLNNSPQRAILESHFRAQHGGRGYKRPQIHKSNPDMINLLFMTARAGNIQGEWYPHRKSTLEKVKTGGKRCNKTKTCSFSSASAPPFSLRTVVSVLRMSLGQRLCGLCPTLISSIFHWENEK